MHMLVHGKGEGTKDVVKFSGALGMAYMGTKKEGPVGRGCGNWVAGAKEKALK